MEMQLLLREPVKRRIADVAAAVAVKARPRLLEATAQEQQLVEAAQVTSWPACQTLAFACQTRASASVVPALAAAAVAAVVAAVGIVVASAPCVVASASACAPSFVD
jgi:hypothetical protein